MTAAGLVDWLAASLYMAAGLRWVFRWRTAREVAEAEAAAFSRGFSEGRRSVERGFREGRESVPRQ